MRKTITILLATVLLFSLFVSCNNGSIVDDAFTCIVTFDGNGADSGEMSTMAVGRGVGIRLKANTFERTDYLFAGWNTEADGSGTAYTDGQSIRVTESTTLYAQWAHKEVTIKYDANGGTGEMSDQVVFTNTAVVLSTNTFTMEGCLFENWNTAADGGGTVYAKGQEISIEEDIILYAQWDTVLKTLTPEMTSWTDGHIYTLGSDVTIGNSITVSGAVTLLLPDGFTLTASKGIIVNSGNSIIINADGNLGTGTLQTTGSSETWGAGIGSANFNNAGSIIINGGRVNAQGGYFAAGIGGGIQTAGGNTTINGGIVNATGGYGGAGIGGGYEGNSGTIAINGGTVNATGNAASGIGGGVSGSAETISISGGSITANGGDASAGIGGSSFGSGGTITITGGSIVAVGGDYGSYPAPGIGRGSTSFSNGTLILGAGVKLQVSSNGSDWSDYDGTTRQKYMRTK